MWILSINLGRVALNKTRIYVTFDYELFFGRKTGSIEKCLLEPTEVLARIAQKHAVHFTFFVDAGMLAAMRRHMNASSEIDEQYSSIVDQLRRLKYEGHSIQLHVHPHWEDSVFCDGKWVHGGTRFRLDQFSQVDIEKIIREYRLELVEVVGADVHAFRAGGWCIQPFSLLMDALHRNGITLDSTLYKNGFMSTALHRFDFRGMPSLPEWFFNDDPLKAESEGIFREIPISVTYYSRLFYLSMALHKIIKAKRYKPVGDGAPVGIGKRDAASLIMNGGEGVVCLDGSRSRLVMPALKRLIGESPESNFVIIAHPKALCENSFEVLDDIASSYSGNFITM